MAAGASSAIAFGMGSRRSRYGGRLLSPILVMGFVFCWMTGPALGQLTDADIANLRERAKQEGWTFEVGHNDATAYSLHELCGTVVPPDWEEPPPDPRLNVRDNLPASWDWRDHDGCTPIRNQGNCGSCWAFAAVGAVESTLLINEGWSTDLSEQWLVSCTDAGTCDGGWHSGALAVMVCDEVFDYCDDCGPVPESEFHYVARDAACGCPYSHPYTIESYGYAGGVNDIDQIKRAIYEYGPVAVTVAVDSAFQAYNGDVFNACWDGTVNHAVVLVGWDDNQGTDGIWIMRNSWGTWWGEDGYMRIEYGCSRIGGNAFFVEYRRDCNNNGIPDADEIAAGTVEDCNGNGIPDECDITTGASTDCNDNDVPDECEMGRSSTIYVDWSATGANTGLTWEDALTSPAAAYCYTQVDDGISEIWVARGTYTPAPPGGSREASFHLASGVAMRGGFVGDETSLEERDWSNPANRTILSGDLLGDDQPGFVNRIDNSYHVVRSDWADATAVLDGFVITGGYASDPLIHNRGGGLYNAGGSPTVINCILIDNYASAAGGAMSNEWGMNGLGSSPTIVNCLLSGNQAEVCAGAIFNDGEFMADVNPVLVNCSIVGNSANSTGGIYGATYCAPTLVNCVLWNNTDSASTEQDAQILCSTVSVDHSCIQGLTGELGGIGNTGANPSFVDADGPDDLLGTLDDNLRLNPGSSCIDAGDNAAVPADIDEDLGGDPRFVDDPIIPDGGGTVVDIGAYEFQGTTCFADLTGDGHIDLADLSALLANYGMTSGAVYADGDLNGDGAVDLSDLSELLSRYGDSCW